MGGTTDYVLEKWLSAINDQLKDIKKELRTANIALSREAITKKGVGQDGTEEKTDKKE